MASAAFRKARAAERIRMNGFPALAFRALRLALDDGAAIEKPPSESLPSSNETPPRRSPGRWNESRNSGLFDQCVSVLRWKRLRALWRELKDAL